MDGTVQEVGAFDLFGNEVVAIPPPEPEKVSPVSKLVGAGKSASLADLIKLYQEVEEALIESGGLADVGDLMTAVEEKIDRKLDNCKGLIDYWKGQVSYLDEKEKLYKARKSSIKNGIEWLRGAMKTALQLAGKEKIKTLEGTYFFSNPKSPVKINHEYMTEKYAEALKRLGLRVHKVVITIPSNAPDFEKVMAAYLKKPIKGSELSVTEPQYDLEGIAERWLQGKRKWPSWLSLAEKTFTIR